MHRVTPGTVSSPRVQDIRHSTPPQSQAKISRWLYATLWMFMVLLHALSAVFLICCAKLYWLMENEYLDYFATLLAPSRDRHFRVVGTALGIIGAAHALQLLTHLGASIISQRLAVRSLNLGSDSMSLITLVIHGLARLGRWVVHHWRISQDGVQQPQYQRGSSMRRGALSNEAYGRIFAIRKTIEIATQVPNGYLYSTLIARSWINHAKVALLVINCWSAFIIHGMLVKNEPVITRIAPARLPVPRRSLRFLAVVVDASLAVATGILLPSAIFFPYLLQFDFETLDFPDTLLYGDTAFPNLVLENRAFFAISWANAVMKGVPHVSAFLCLLSIASMLDAASKPESTSPAIRGPRSPRRNNKRSTVATASYRALMRATNNVQSSTKLIRHVHRLSAPLLFMVTGAVVLGLHLDAHYGRVNGDMDIMNSFCLQRMHQWLAPNFSCAVVKYNCYREGVSSPLSESLDWLEREAVRSLMFLHCSAFVMPSIIREFPYLMGVELWNTTLLSWGEEAAVSAKLHPNLLFAIFSFVNMTRIPTGILQQPLPEQLTDLEFIHTNLTTLPDEIEHSWKSVELVYIEHSKLNPFPAVLMQLPFLSELSLIDNKFESIPKDVLLSGASTYFYDLALSKNPLKTLPEARTEDFDVSNLALEFTKLRDLPEWVTTNVWESVSLGGSPVCEDTNINIPEIAVCGDNDDAWDPLGEERYPTAFTSLSRSLYA
ncbi:unnamed protein product [Phytophthora lilii]|uniref:Unnamed protein product n=1 Tax=Phytophthora lilii TaxID=2077276 RepID=A0A9W6WWT6_9STRA|nr:unnamed protein product [Phytophthora lilii]